MYVDGVDVRYDEVHLTISGGVVFESRISPTVVRWGREQMKKAPGPGSLVWQGLSTGRSWCILRESRPRRLVEQRDP